jgi:hypothetical protein
VSDYTRVALVGASEELVLEPVDVALLFSALDAELDRLDDKYRMLDDGAELDALEVWIDELASLRDAVHSVATDPVDGQRTGDDEYDRGAL